MDLLEYQAKELFREIGIPVLPSQRIDNPRDLKGLKIPYPVVLKSQVPIGGRGKAGGIKFVENTIDAIAAAQTIFHLPIMGQYPQVLLAEARYDAEREFYLAVALDYTLRRPVLLGSPQGGMDVEGVMAQMQQVVIDQEFSPFYARRLALKMGLEGNLIQSVSAIIEAMYKLFVQKDLDLVEINPLGVSATGEVMALDGKVTANDSALGRHPDLKTLLTKLRSSQLPSYHCDNGTKPIASNENLWEMDGNIAIVCNGTGLAMATLDMVYQAGGKPARCVNLGEDMFGNCAETLCDRLQKGIERIIQEDGVRVLLVNILGSVPNCTEIASAIATYLQQSGSELPIPFANNSRQRRPNNGSNETHDGQFPYFIVRMGGTQIEAAKESLKSSGVFVVDSLDEAVSQAVALAKPTASGRRSRSTLGGAE